jgi:hypothetical protein
VDVVECATAAVFEQVVAVAAGLVAAAVVSGVALDSELQLESWIRDCGSGAMRRYGQMHCSWRG